MKKMNYIKFSLDLLMGITFVLFYNKNVLGGLAFHEIAGLVMCVVFLTHILLNAGWVKRVTLKIFDRKLPGKTRFSYLLNVLLLITMTFVMVSGIIISRIVFPNLNIGNEQWFKMTHMSVSYLTLVIVAIHIGLHWQWVMTVTKKIFPVTQTKPIFGHIAKVVTLLILLFGVYEMYTTGFGTKLASSVNVFAASSQQGGEEFMGKGEMGEMGDRPDFSDGERPEAPSGSFDQSQMPSGENGFSKGERSGEGFDHEHGGSANVFVVISTYVGIMSIFIVITYYVGKFLGRRRNKSREIYN